MAGKSLASHFGCIPDPRVKRTRRHELMDMIVIAVCGAICGADDWVAIELFGRAKVGWLRQYLELPNGIPSHDTFGRVFARIDPEAFEACFLTWVQAVFEVKTGQVVAVDGKWSRASYDRTEGKAALQMVSAWATESQLVLGQRQVNPTSNEISAIPVLLALLELEGCIVTIDAIGCQKAIATQLVEQGADYILAVKGNQPALFQEMQDLFAYADEIAYHPVVADACLTLSKHHGRFEKRYCWTIADPDFALYLRHRDCWHGLQTLVKVQTHRTTRSRTSVETRFFISSLPHDAPALLAAIRAHWGIENRLHWSLDIAFAEDRSRVRKDHAPHNLAILRHIALNLLKRDPSSVGIKNRRLRAAWDSNFLLHLLFPSPPL